MREERVVDTGLEYAPGERVRLRVVHREQRTSVSDDGSAVERAGRPPGWREVADHIENDLNVNVSRQGAAWLPVVPACPSEDVVIRRVGEASLTLYQDLLDLE